MAWQTLKCRITSVYKCCIDAAEDLEKLYSFILKTENIIIFPQKHVFSVWNLEVHFSTSPTQYMKLHAKVYHSIATLWVLTFNSSKVVN